MAESFKFREWERQASIESRMTGMAALTKTASVHGRKQLAVFTTGKHPAVLQGGKSHLALGKNLSLLALFNKIFKISSGKCQLNTLCEEYKPG